MKIVEDMRFPHPVLWEQTTDYSAGVFGVSLQIAETATTGALKAKCSVVLTEDHLSSLIAAGQAKVGISVVCLDTYFNQLITVASSGGDLEIPAGRLRGQVRFRPLVWAASPIDGFLSSNVHPEFGTAPLRFESAAVLAIGEDMVISVGSDKLAPIASVFELARNDDVPANRVAIDLEEEKVQILAAQSTYEKIHALRNTARGRDLLLNSVYLPVVMEVISAMRDSGQMYEGRRWYRVFRAKLDHLAISVSGAELIEVAQTLLQSPFGRLDSFVEMSA